MKKCYAMIHVWLHDMDHNIDLNYCRKIRPISLFIARMAVFKVIQAVSVVIWMEFELISPVCGNLSLTFTPFRLKNKFYSNFSR